MTSAGLAWVAVQLLGAAAPALAAQPITLSLGASGAVSDKVLLTGTADDAHSCALIGPSGGPQTYLFLFDKSPADAMLDPHRPGLFLTVAGVHAATGKQGDSANGTIQVSIGGRLFLGLGQDDAAFRLRVSLRPDGAGGNFTATHLLDLSGTAAVDVEGSWRCPLARTAARESAPPTQMADASPAGLPPAIPAPAPAGTAGSAKAAPPPPAAPVPPAPQVASAKPASPAAASPAAASPPAASPPAASPPAASPAAASPPAASASAANAPAVAGAPALSEPSKPAAPASVQRSELAASFVPLHAPPKAPGVVPPTPSRPAAEAWRTGHFRLFRSPDHCRRPCAGWAAVDLGNGRRFEAAADFTPVGLAPRLAAEARAGRIELLVSGEVVHKAGHPAEIRVRRLDGVAPHAVARSRKKHSA